MSEYSSQQAARKLGVIAPTLSKYIKAGKIPAPRSVTAGGITVYLWTDEEIQRVRELLPKIKNGRKTRHRKEQKPKKPTKPKKK